MNNILQQIKGYRSGEITGAQYVSVTPEEVYTPPLADNTSQVRGDSSMLPEVVANAAAARPYTKPVDTSVDPEVITPAEWDMVCKYRDGKLVPKAVPNSTVAKWIKTNPVLGMLNYAIRTVFPHGVGTYIFTGALLVACIAAGMGYNVPLLNIPEEMAGSGGIIAIILFFIRNSKGQ